MGLKCLLKIARNSNNYRFYLPNFLKFYDDTHINYRDEVNSQKNSWKFWNGPLCRNKSGPFPQLDVAAYWQNWNTKSCTKKLSRILAKNIDNGGREICLRIYVHYCRRTSAEKVLRDKVFNIAKNPRYNGYQRGLALTVYKFLNKKTSGVLLKMKLYKMKNQLKNYTNQLLGNLGNEKYTHLFSIIPQLLRLSGDVD